MVNALIQQQRYELYGPPFGSMTRDVKGPCRLCEKTARLHESHIVSRFLLKNSGVTGDKRRFDLTCITHPQLSEPYRQDGFKEHLLCAACESRLGQWEDYARRKLYGKNNPFATVAQDGLIWRNLDYRSMRLFTTSLLWRMSISSHPFYACVNLGVRHETRIREMLLSGNPMEVWRYGCSIGFLFFGQNPLGGIFSQPKRILGNDRSRYGMVLAGFLICYYVASHSPPARDCVGFLQPIGTWVVPSVQALEVPFIKSEIDLFRQIKGTVP